MDYKKKYSKYKNKYVESKKYGNILLMPFNYIGKRNSETNQYFTNLLSPLGKVYIYEFKFNNITNEFNINDYYFKYVAKDIKQFINKHNIEKPIIVCLEHASPYGLYFVDTYPNLVKGIICYPLRLYSKESLNRRIWKYKDQGGWDKYISKKYNFDDYYLNPSNKIIKELLSNP